MGDGGGDVSGGGRWDGLDADAPPEFDVNVEMHGFGDDFVTVEWDWHGMDGVSLLGATEENPPSITITVTNLTGLDRVCGAQLTPEELFALPPSEAQRMADGVCRLPKGHDDGVHEEEGT